LDDSLRRTHFQFHFRANFSLTQQIFLLGNRHFPIVKDYHVVSGFAFYSRTSLFFYVYYVSFAFIKH